MSDIEMERKCLSELKGLIKDSKDPQLLSIVEDEEFLRIFLVGRKLNVKHAMDTAKGYLTSKYVKHPRIFQMKPKSVQHVLESGFVGFLKHRDHLGRVIAFARVPKLDLKTMECEDIVRASTLLAESLWSNMEEMRKGQIAVIDYSGYNISVMTRYSLGDKITFMNVFWQNYPMQVKGVHAVNNPRIVSYAYSIIRPFIPKKVKERLMMHGSDMESLHKYISPDILPAWLGGNLSDEEAVDHEVVKRILSSQSSS
jgi:hypothetical protein